MTQSKAQRILLDHRYRTQLPFPVSTNYYRYSCSKNIAVRAHMIVRTAESTLRYAAIVAACDYATNPDADQKVLNFLRNQWLSGKPFSFGHWSMGLEKILKEFRKTWSDPVIPEFGQINSKLFKNAIEAIVSDRNRMLGHAETYGKLSFKELVQEHEDDLFTILEQLEFLSQYPLCFAEIEDEEELVKGSRQTIYLCRGAWSRFVQFTVTPSEPITPGVPFIWNSSFDRILTLSPFFLYGRASTRKQEKQKKSKILVKASYQGLMVLSGSKESTSYTSLDEEAHFALEAIVIPKPDTIGKQIREVLQRDSEIPIRFKTSLSKKEKDQFGKQPGDVPAGAEFKGEKDTYIVEKESILGRGGMGVVYLVRRKSDGLHCALKAMPLELMAVGSMVKRFEREGRMLLQLSQEGNPNLIHLFEVGYQEPYHFLVMEYVEGGSLAEELFLRSGANVPFPLGEAMDIIRQICNCVQSIHQRGIIHRDLKPANILMATKQRGEVSSVIPKVTDFGLARRINHQSIALTAELGAIGTFEFMAPEQFDDSGHKLDQRADIFAIGKIFAQMITGTIPKNAEEIKVMDFSAMVKATESDGARVPVEGIKDVLINCLAKNPEDRFDSVDAFLDALEKAPIIDAACKGTEEMGITRPEVRAAFGLAKIGHPRARQQLLEWSAHREDPEKHEQAAVALVAIDDKGINDLIAATDRDDATDLELDQESLEREESLIHALSCALRWKEKFQPQTWGQSWLAGLSNRLRQKVKRIYVSDNLQTISKKLFRITARHALLVALMAGLVSIGGSFFEGNVLWRTHHTTAPIRVLMFFFGSMMAGILWGVFYPVAYFVGKQFERPRRYLMILLLGVVAAGLSAVIIAGFMMSQGRADLAVACGTPSAAAFLLVRYFTALSLLASSGFTLYYILKEFPIIKRVIPSKLITVFLMPIFTVLLATPTILLFANTPFYMKELIGEMSVVYGAALGFGFADYLYDTRKAKKEKSIQAPAQGQS